MENDIIHSGFLAAEKDHGVRYTRFIGDGDSSVHTTLIQGIPGWGYAIKKIECANHACKFYRSALEKLVQQNSSYKGSGRLTEKMRKKLVSGARCAIRMRSREPDRRKAVKFLERDLVNGPRQCFGYHSECTFVLQKSTSLNRASPSTNIETDNRHDQQSTTEDVDDPSDDMEILGKSITNL